MGQCDRDSILVESTSTGIFNLKRTGLMYFKCLLKVMKVTQYIACLAQNEISLSGKYNSLISFCNEARLILVVN